MKVRSEDMEESASYSVEGSLAEPSAGRQIREMTQEINRLGALEGRSFHS